MLGREENAVHNKAAAAASVRGRTPEPAGSRGSEPLAHMAQFLQDGFGLPGLRRVLRHKKSQNRFGEVTEIKVGRTAMNWYKLLQTVKLEVISHRLRHVMSLY